MDPIFSSVAVYDGMSGTRTTTSSRLISSRCARFARICVLLTPIRAMCCCSSATFRSKNTRSMNGRIFTKSCHSKNPFVWMVVWMPSVLSEQRSGSRKPIWYVGSPSGQCDTAVRRLVKETVSQQNFDEFRDLIASPDQFQSSSRAGIGAFPATRAAFSIDPVRSLQVDRVLGTCLYAVATAYASGCMKYSLRKRRNQLRVVAPGAFQGTSLEKDGRPDARPIMDRIALDTADESLIHRGGESF